MARGSVSAAALPKVTRWFPSGSPSSARPKSGAAFAWNAKLAKTAVQKLGAKEVSTDDLRKSVVLNFPGGVWNYSEGEAEQDIRTGHCRSVTLHVENEHEALVFALADVLALYLT